VVIYPYILGFARRKSYIWGLSFSDKRAFDYIPVWSSKKAG
ncbi:unnamed protein product, partial [marine sediment metagenome]